MLNIPRLRNLVREIGEHGLLFGARSPWSADPGIEPGSAAEALPAVAAYVKEPQLPDGVDGAGLTDKDIALALVAGARRAALDVAAVERAAAAVARERGATVRELAAAAGISERAANDRYRRAPGTGTAMAKNGGTTAARTLVSCTTCHGSAGKYVDGEWVTCADCRQGQRWIYR